MKFHVTQTKLQRFRVIKAYFRHFHPNSVFWVAADEFCINCHFFCFSRLHTTQWTEKSSSPLNLKVWPEKCQYMTPLHTYIHPIIHLPLPPPLLHFLPQLPTPSNYLPSPFPYFLPLCPLFCPPNTQKNINNRGLDFYHFLPH